MHPIYHALRRASPRQPPLREFKAMAELRLLASPLTSSVSTAIGRLGGRSHLCTFPISRRASHRGQPSMPFYPCRMHRAFISTKDSEHGESQGHTVEKKDGPFASKDVQTQAAKAGFEARKRSDHTCDAASEIRGVGEKPRERGQGNKEGVGMFEQVGGLSGSAKHWEEVEREREEAEKANKDGKGTWVPM